MPAATPSPTSWWPSRIEPGRGMRRLHPKRSAPRRRHWTSWRSEYGRFGFSGSTWVSLRTRNSTGSMPSFSAISSMATSSAMRPGASPGARMALPSGRSSTARRVEVRRLAPAYMSLVWLTAVSGSPWGRLPEALSCAMAVMVPSRSAPMRMRWMVAARCVVLLAIMGRVSATLTGRPAALAPMAAITASDRTNSLPPKPPPT